MSKNTRHQIRQIAFQLLYELDLQKCLQEKQYTFQSRILELGANESSIIPISKMVMGTLENLSAIDLLIESTSERWRLDRMPTVDRNVLRIATFEIIYDSTPPAVVIDEAVELGKQFGSEDSGKFVNGVLDAIHKKSKE